MTKFMIAILLVWSWFAQPNLDSKEVQLSKNETIVAMFEEMNEKRVRAGLPEMVLDEELCALSQRWSNRMAKTGSFHH
ncbi:MAG: CAP domain-containing protein, partial [Planctomycetota bacterium]|nr:CAP domain-containing protein [Planctomycetota bacterium]